VTGITARHPEAELFSVVNMFRSRLDVCLHPLIFGLLQILAVAQAPERRKIPDPYALVKAAIEHQLRNDQNLARFRYCQRRAGKGPQTYELIESDAGTVEWLVAKNDRSLTDAELRKESAWLERLRGNPEIMRKAQQERRAEEQRRGKLIRALPAAFLYRIEAEEDEGRIIRLRFRSNPDFKATSRETQICRGLEGRLWIDVQNLMFVKAEGKLVRNVSFGWGFLGNLDPGGTFSLAQTEVNPGVWRVTRIQVNLTGTKLLFKSIKIRVDEQTLGFQRVPGHLNLENAIQMLRVSATPCSVSKP
jgi:hypothetical protein